MLVHDHNSHDDHHDHHHGPAPAQGHAHDHGHTHDHGALAAGANGRALLLAIVLNTGFVVFELLAGWRAQSLALISDAGHNLGDVLSLGLAWAGLWAARRPTSDRFTWGWQRASVMAALINALLLLVAAGAIGWEAIGRLQSPTPVDNRLVMIVAAAGILINSGSAWILTRGQHAHDVNMRGAFLHMVADAAVSAGVVIGAFIVSMTGWLIVDPIISAVIAVLIAVSAWPMLKQATGLAMDSVPGHIEPAAVRAHLLAMPGVSDLHDLHIWPLGTTGASLSAHLIMPAGPPGDAFLHAASESLQHRFGIEHTTLQVESGAVDLPCRQNCAART